MSTLASKLDLYQIGGLSTAPIHVPIDERHIESCRVAYGPPCLRPRELSKSLPVYEKQAQVINRSREAVQNILRGSDDRLLIIAGPCSVYNPEATLEYAKGLSKIAKEVEDKIVVIMRVYPEKPRTKGGWAGMASDPHLDGSDDVGFGIRQTRKLMLDVLGEGIGLATEILNTEWAEYWAYLQAWACIGARTTTSPSHRKVGAALPCPVGFKNSPEERIAGNSIRDAVNAISVARTPCTVTGHNELGELCEVRCKGNEDSHLVLRGTDSGPNFNRTSLKLAESILKAEKVESKIIVDCSHANSGKNYLLQAGVFNQVLRSRLDADITSICGLMLESDLREGSQKTPKERGVSITDSCIDLASTGYLIRCAHKMLSNQRPAHAANRNYP